MSLKDCGKNKKGVRFRNRSAPQLSTGLRLEAELGFPLCAERYGHSDNLRILIV